MPIIRKNGAQPKYNARPRPRASSYEVGYAKPPKHSQFKKGQSGNPRGRPREAKSLNVIVREVMLEKVAIRTAKGEKRVSRAEALVLKNLELATKGNGRALEKLLQLFQTAVPDRPKARDEMATTADSEADLAILNALRAELRGEAIGALDE